MRTQSGAPHADELISRLAAAQHGVMARRQLVEAGLPRGAIGRRVRAGRLVRIHPGVYAAGHSELTVDGRWMAAVLACGPGAALSHRAATAAYALRPAWRHWLEVSVTNDLRVPGILIHRVRDLTDVTSVRGIPITTVARTLTDLADVTNPRILQQVLDQAEILRLHAPVEVINGRRGAGSLRRALAEIDPFPHVPRSELERRFTEIVGRRPAMGMVIEGYETDFAWPEHKLVVEVDGWETHRTRRAFAADRRKDVVLKLAGWTVLRFTYHDVVHEPEYVTATLTRSCGRSMSTTWGGSG
jgi:very-short-patch-repair endonuclease